MTYSQTLLRASIIALIAIIGVIESRNIEFEDRIELAEEIDTEYRPWIHSGSSTTWISLESMGITRVNSMFGLKIPNLRWLVLDYNRIQIINPEAFTHLSDLTYLSLASNEIDFLEWNPFAELKKLQVLDLDRNSFKGYLNCEPFSQLPALKRLYLRYSKITSFDPGMGTFARLYLSHNELRRIYPSNGSTLTHLYLDNNELNSFSLSGFRSLTYLNLQSNRIKQIVRQVEEEPTESESDDDQSYDGSLLIPDDAVALQYLIVSFNELSQIDSDAFKGTEALVHVNLTGNEISSVQAGTFNDLLFLEEIILDSNQLTELGRGVFVNLPNLRIISLKNNAIDDLDADTFTNLNSTVDDVHLYLDNNNIRTLSKGLFRGIRGLKHIGLNGNEIQIISTQAFLDLPNLKSIVIEHQKLEKPWLESREKIIKSDAFFDLINLASITIRDNSFTKIEARAFHNLPKLTTLDLFNNKIDTILSEAFYDLPAIEYLYLGGNSLSQIAPNTFPTHLKHLDLSWNNLSSNYSSWQIQDLSELDELDVTGIIDRFKIEDYLDFPKFITVIVQNVRSEQFRFNNQGHQRTMKKKNHR